IRRVGSTKEIEVNVRILAATALKLEEEVRQQRFRLDFYHRINVARIELPPLRARGEDILLLARHLLKRYAAEMDKSSVELTSDVMEVLTSYSWPGNVRELQNVLKRSLAVMRQTTISLEDLPEEIVAATESLSGQDDGGFIALRERRLAAFEKEYFRNLLSGCHGDVSAAAREARLTRGSLYRFLKRHELNPADFRSPEAKFDI
ncbi:MAG: sigma-54-dependent Fis family transcriptional regulator, partial [Verrucomicrobia bacterium]|nr:sigma-54-dependent Fis family transcriptional regulator [Verrucomicrobiota bacterium]